MKQHDKPCGECPFQRGIEVKDHKVGGSGPPTYIGQARGPFLLSCHKSPGYWDDPRGTQHAQCAGAAIFRANCGWADVMPAGLLHLPPNFAAVFSTPAEMAAHYEGVPVFLAEVLLSVLTPERLMVAEMSRPGTKTLKVSP